MIKSSLFLSLILGFSTIASASKPESVILDRKDMVSIAKDGKTTLMHSSKEVINTRASMNIWLDKRIRWNKRYQLFSLSKAYTLFKGKKVNTPKEAINVVTPFHQEMVPNGSPWRDTVVSLIGAKYGSKTMISWMLKDKNKRSWPYEKLFPLVQSRGVKRYKLMITGEYKGDAIMLPKQCRMKKSNGALMVSCKNLPSTGRLNIVGRHGKHHFVESIQARVVVSGWKSWSEFSDTILKYSKNYNNYILKMRSPPTLKKRIKSKISQSSLFNALTLFVSSEMKTLQIKRPPESPKNIVKYRGANRLEKALVLAGLMKKYLADSQSDIVFISKSHKIAKDVPGLMQFPIYGVVFKLENRKYIYTVENNSISRWPDAFAGYYYFIPGKTSAPQKVSSNLSGYIRRLSINIKVDSKGYNGEGEFYAASSVSQIECNSVLPLSDATVLSCETASKGLGEVKYKFKFKGNLILNKILKIKGMKSLLGGSIWPYFYQERRAAMSTVPFESMVKLNISWKDKKLFSLSQGLFKTVKTKIARAFLILTPSCKIAGLMRSHNLSVNSTCKNKNHVVFGTSYEKSLPLITDRAKNKKAMSPTILVFK